MKTVVTKRDALEFIVDGVAWIDNQMGICRFPCRAGQASCERFVWFDGKAVLTCLNKECGRNKRVAFSSRILQRMANAMP